MAAETSRVKAKLSTLSNSLDDIEAQLEPLLAQSLPETVLSLETIQQAKLQVVLPYLVYDLIFIYLKANGIDPKTHPVVTELDRVRQYFNKIKNAEEANKKAPRATVDKAAANRFIKHAIAQAKFGRPPGDNAEPTPSDIRVPVKVTSKMVEREKYEQELNEMSEEEDLQVFDDVSVPEGEGEEGEEVAEEIKLSKGKGKGKQKAEDDSQIGVKRRRPRMDPFAGYGEDTDTPTVQSSKKNRPMTLLNDERNVSTDLSQNNSGRSTPLSSTASISKKEAKAAKRAKRKSKASSK